MKRSQMLNNIRVGLGKMEEVKTEKIFTQSSLKINHYPSFEQSPSKSETIKNDLQLRFVLEAQKNGTTILEVDEWTKIPHTLNSHLNEISHNKNKIRCMDKHILNLPWMSVGLDVESTPPSSEDKIAISVGCSAIAETGTVMLASSPSSPTSLAFLPETHAVIVQKNQIQATLEDAFAHLHQVYHSKPLPRSINLISGASRTGDIGGRIIHGAHGPLRFIVFLLTSNSPVFQY